MFEKGKSGNPSGRPAGAVSPKTIAINIIFSAFEECGAEKFKQQMKELADKNPVAFYLKFIQPIQPKDFNIQGSFEFGKIMEEFIVQRLEQIRALRNK